MNTAPADLMSQSARKGPGGGSILIPPSINRRWKGRKNVENHLISFLVKLRDKITHRKVLQLCRDQAKYAEVEDDPHPDYKELRKVL